MALAKVLGDCGKLWRGTWHSMAIRAGTFLSLSPRRHRRRLRFTSADKVSLCNLSEQQDGGQAGGAGWSSKSRHQVDEWVSTGSRIQIT